MVKKCPKCSGKMRRKRITITEFHQKFLVSILECEYCKFWFQSIDLKIDGILPFENWDITYDDKIFSLMSEKVRNNLDTTRISRTNVWETYSCSEKFNFEEFFSKAEDTFDKDIHSIISRL
ncbi:MAG: hypothetical protein ACTSUE_05360 [Promethearchaeota archaeon]